MKIILLLGIITLQEWNNLLPIQQQEIAQEIGQRYLDNHQSCESALVEVSLNKDGNIQFSTQCVQRSKSVF